MNQNNIDQNNILLNFFTYVKEKHGEKGMQEVAENDESFEKYFNEFMNKYEKTFPTDYLQSLLKDLNERSLEFLEEIKK